MVDDTLLVGFDGILASVSFVLLILGYEKLIYFAFAVIWIKFS